MPSLLETLQPNCCVVITRKYVLVRLAMWGSVDGAVNPCLRDLHVEDTL